MKPTATPNATSADPAARIASYELAYKAQATRDKLNDLRSALDAERAWLSAADWCRRGSVVLLSFGVCAIAIPPHLTGPGCAALAAVALLEMAKRSCERLSWSWGMTRRALVDVAHRPSGRELDPFVDSDHNQPSPPVVVGATAAAGGE